MQDSLVGTTLDSRYEILSVLGKGSLGVVYKARHQLMQRIVAIKVFKESLASSKGSLESFRKEATAVCAVNHPNIIAVHDFGINDRQQPYLVMDCVQGWSLADEIKGKGPLPVTLALSVFRQICAALACAHQKGLVHANLRPSNIMLVQTNSRPYFVQVVDFGFANLRSDAAMCKHETGTAGEIAKDLACTSPEQRRHEQPDARSDIYSLGVLMYETVTGAPASTLTPLPPLPPQMEQAAALSGIIFKALSVNPNDRYQSMNELAGALDAVRKAVKGRDEVWTAISPPAQAKSPEAQKRTGLALRILAILAICCGFACWWITTTTRGQIALKEMSLMVVELRAPSDNARAASNLNALISLYTTAGDLNSAIQRCKQLAAILNGSNPATREHLAATYEKLAVLYYRQGKRDDATESLDKAAAICDDLYYVIADKAGQAATERFLKPLFRTEQLVLEPDDPRFATICYQLGLVSMAKNQLDAAEESFRRVIRLGEKYQYGERTTSYVTRWIVLDSLVNLGEVRYRQKRYAEAEDLFKQAALLAPENDSTRGYTHSSYERLAAFYSEEHRDEDALAAYQKSFAARKFYFIPKDENYYADQRWVAQYYSRRGKYNLAEPSYKEVSANAGKIGIELDATFYNEFARCLRANGKTVEARALETRLKTGNIH